MLQNTKLIHINPEKNWQYFCGTLKEMGKDRKKYVNNMVDVFYFLKHFQMLV